jgi:hypothetical protein
VAGENLALDGEGSVAIGRIAVGVDRREVDPVVLREIGD